MTAEVAILNKSAVALAADSAVTISAGTKEEKIFDTADKLFELSRTDAIGVMVYNGMSFAETPLPPLIAEFRIRCEPFAKVEDAARAFLRFLDEFGRNASQRVRTSSMTTLVEPVLTDIIERFQSRFNRMMATPEEVDKLKSVDDFITKRSEMLDNAIQVHEGYYTRLDDANFVGDGPIEFSDETSTALGKLIDGKFEALRLSPEQRAKVLDVAG